MYWKCFLSAGRHVSHPINTSIASRVSAGKLRTLNSECFLSAVLQCGDYHYGLSYDTGHKYKSYGFRFGERGGYSPLLTLVTKSTLYTRIYCTDCLKNGPRMFRNRKSAQRSFPNV
jgi:hypothetical protein